MKRRSARRSLKRSPQEWALRGTLGIIALVLGYVSTTRTLGYAVLRSNAEQAYALAPNDGRIAGELAQQISASDANPAQRARANRLAHQALVDEPLAISALTALGLNAQLAGNTNLARRLFLHSDALSRRELGTRLWLIEDAVGRGDVNNALHHYDIALRTEKGASNLLFPVLGEAMADPAIATALAHTLAARPPWGAGFVDYLASASIDPLVRAAFLDDIARRGVSVAGNVQASAVNGLIGAGKIEQGWAYYTRLRKDARRDQARNPNFTVHVDAPTIFDWTPINSEDGLNATLEDALGGGVVDFAAPATVGGVVLEQTQLLRPGRYHLAGMSAGIDQPVGSQPYWQLACKDGRELGRVSLTNSVVAAGRFEGSILVGTDCPVQILRLVIRPSSAVGGVSGQIRRITLGPEKQR